MTIKSVPGTEQTADRATEAADVEPTAPASATLTERVWRRRHVIAVGSLTVATAGVYFVYLLVGFRGLHYGLLDLGIYDQAVQGYSHLHGPHSPVVALPSPTDPGKLQLSDHFTPILAVVAPLYWIHNSPVTLLFATAVLSALPIPPVWVFTRRALGTPAAYLVAIVYAVAWQVQNALWFGFHEVAFALPIMALMLERAQAGRRRQAAAVSLLLLFVKDDMGFVVVVFGILLLFRGGLREGWRAIRVSLGRGTPFGKRLSTIGAATMVLGGLGMVMLVNSVLIPAAGGDPKRNWTYDSLAATPGKLVEFIVLHPWTSLHRMVTPDVKATTLLWSFAPLLFLPLLSPITLLAVPLIVERMLSDNQIYWGMGLHYNAFLVVILLLAAVDGAARLVRWIEPLRRNGIPVLARAAHVGSAHVGTAWALTAAVIALAVMPKWPLWDMTKSLWWQETTTYDVRSANQAAHRVPDHVLVAAAANVGPLLLSRTKVFMWSHPGDRTPVDQPPWVLADVKRAAYPWPSVADQRKRVDELIADGYLVVFERDGYVVLHKP